MSSKSEVVCLLFVYINYAIIGFTQNNFKEWMVAIVSELHHFWVCSWNGVHVQQ